MWFPALEAKDMWEENTLLCSQRASAEFAIVTLISLKDAYLIAATEGNGFPVIDTDLMACP